MPTFTYAFNTPLPTLFTVTTEAQPRTGIDLPDDVPYTGYFITGISGTFNGETIDGLLDRNNDGDGDDAGYDPDAGPFDNVVFIDDTQGDASFANAAGGSSYGIDDYGFGFTTNGGANHYGLLYNFDGTYSYATAGVNPSAPFTLTASDAPCYCTGTLIRTTR